jgi:hypothetical protein
MKPTRLPKEVLPPDWASRDTERTKGDLVYCVPYAYTHSISEFHVDWYYKNVF